MDHRDRGCGAKAYGVRAVTVTHTVQRGIVFFFASASAFSRTERHMHYMFLFSNTHKHTSQIHTQPEPATLNSQCAQCLRAVPATDKWAVECRDGPCDRTWHSDTFTSLDSHGWSDTVALTLATATADQSVTLLENSRAGRKRAASSMRGRKREFLWGCVCVHSCVSVMQVWTCFVLFFCDIHGCDMSQRIQALIFQSKVTYVNGQLNRNITRKNDNFKVIKSQ